MRDRYFLVRNIDGGVLGVFQLNRGRGNEIADGFIMDMVCDHYCLEDCSLDKGFKVEDYHGKPLSITTTFEDYDGVKVHVELKIEEIGLYN